MRRRFIVVVVLFLLACNTLAAPLQSPAPTFAPTSTAAASATLAPIEPSATSAPTVEPTPSTWPPPIDAPGGMVAGPVADAERAAASALANADYPPADFVALAESLGGVSGPIPRVVATAPADWKVGDEADFWVLNNETVEFTSVPMQLRAIGQHAYLWFDLGVRFSNAEARRAAAAFDDVYTRDREQFGFEANPGIDGDPRIYILHTTGERMGGGVGGYLDDTSGLPKTAFAHSNEHELFVMNSVYLGGDLTDYASTLAHEFQHMIHGNYDENDEDWVVEGSAVYAQDVLGFGGESGYAFLANPDLQLNTWTQLGGADYDKGFLFVRYVADRFGAEFVRDWLQRPENGLHGLDAALQAAGSSVTAADVFKGWIVANLIGDNPRAAAEYRYKGLNFSAVIPQPLADLPDATVSQYAADYYALDNSRDLHIEFDGTAKVRPIPAAPHSGEYFWWSGRANNSDITLTREFDLSAVSAATLHYWAWFDIEQGWDYGYVVVSSDGGKTWRGLATPAMTDYDPQNKTYTDRAYTGDSGGAWVEESADLTPFAGKKILLRFEYVTDPILTQSGLAIDDLSIPEINFYDDAENDAGWQASGFNRVTAYLPQEWSLQLVTDVGGAPRVESIELADGARASFDVPARSDAVLIVSASAPTTLEPAAYAISVR